MTMKPIARLLSRAAPPALVLALVLATGAAVPSASQPTPGPMARATLPPDASFEWMDAAVTAGDWRWRAVDGESFAGFYTADNRLLAEFTCTPEGEILISVANSAPSASGITVRTETQGRLLPTMLQQGWIQAVLPRHDNLLDAIAFSRGRFALEVGSGQALYLPSYPEITRVVEDCR